MHEPWAAGQLAPQAAEAKSEGREWGGQARLEGVIRLGQYTRV